MEPADTLFGQPGGPAPDPGTALCPGSRVASYEVIRKLGEGGMGAVFLARDLKLGRRVALKTIRPERLASGRAIPRFIREAQAMARLAHPHIVTVFSVGEEPGWVWLAMEYLDGESLKERLGRGNPSFSEALRWGRAIAEAIVEAHAQGIIHRDLKPANVMIPRDGRLRVVDFGLARFTNQEPATPAPGLPEATVSESFFQEFAAPGPQTDGVVGTPEYMAPEQWRKQDLDRAVDVWAIGVILFEMTAGHRPYGGSPLDIAIEVCGRSDPPDLASIVPGLPAAFCELVGRCIARDPSLRPTAAELVSQLDCLAGTGAARGRSTGTPYRGLLSFGPRHAGSFFGRPAEIEMFLERLRREPMLPVAGPSGAGKSSFVLAGVIPALLDRGGWTALVLRPGDRPLRSLAQRVAAGADGWISVSASEADIPLKPPTSHSEADVIEALLLQAPQTLGERLRQAASRLGSRILLVVDQLEELYTLGASPEEKRCFVRALAMAADDSMSPVRVVFTIRDDFLGRLADDTDLRDVVDRGVTLLRMPDAAELREILLRPIEPLGYRFEDERLVQAMIEGVRTESAGLPLLQFAALRLWEMRDESSRLLTWSSYRSMGGVEGALAHHADGVLASLGPGQGRLARSLLLGLVTEDSTRAQVYLASLIQEHGPEISPVLERLVEARLLHARRTADGESLIELSHESLVNRWERLRLWRDEARVDLQFLGQLRIASRTWSEHGGRDSDLWHGETLDEALSWRRRFPGELPENVRLFLVASEKEGARRQRTRRRALVGSLAGALALAAVAIVVAFSISRQAHEIRRHLGESLLSDARASLVLEEYPQARAKLRASLEAVDSIGARGLWHRLERDPKRLVMHMGTTLHDVAMSPDGRSLAVAVSATQSSFVALIDEETGQIVSKLGGETSALAFDADGRRLAAIQMWGKISVFDTETGAFLYAVPNETYARWTGFSADGRWVHTEDSVWDIASRARVTSNCADGLPLSRVRFVPGTNLVSSIAGSSVILCDLASGRVVGTLPTPGLLLGAQSWSSDGGTFIWADGDHGIHLLDRHTASERSLLRIADQVADVVVSPQGLYAAVSDQAGMVHVFDAARQAELATWPAQTDNPYIFLSFHTTGERLAGASRDGMLRVWDVPALQRIPQTSHVEFSKGISFSPDGRTLLSGGWDGRLLSWDLETGRAVAWGRGRGTGAVGGISFHRDGRTVSSSHMDGRIQLWDTQTHRLRSTYVPWDGIPTKDVVAGADGTFFASGYAGAVVEVDVENRPLRSFGTSEHLRGVGVSPDGRVLAAAGHERLHLWDLMTGSESGVFNDGEGISESLAFHPVERLIALAGGSTRVRFLDYSAKEVVFPGVIPGAQDLAFSPDGALLAVPIAGPVGGVALWDYRQGIEVGRLRESPASEISSIAFSPDGRLIAATSADASVRVWDLSTGLLRWRAPLLLPLGDGALMATQGGLQFLPPGEQRELMPLAEGAMEETWRAPMQSVVGRGRLAALSPGRKTLALVTSTGQAERWDLGTGQRAGTASTGFVESLVALEDGFVVLAEALVTRWRCSEADTPCAPEPIEGPEATFLSATPDGGFFVGNAEFVREMDASGGERMRVPSGQGSSAVTRTGHFLVIGFEDGSVEGRLISSGSPKEDRPRTLERGSEHAVTILARGPEGLVAGGYRDGSVVLWDLANGSLLDRARLHGPVTHLFLHGDTLHASTQLGDHLSWDLSVFSADYCDVLRLIWNRVHVAWEEGGVRRREAPSGHLCSP